MAVKKQTQAQEPEITESSNEPKKKAKAVIYVGPSIKNVVDNKQVFLSLPTAVKEFQKDCSEIEHLFVNVGEDYRAALQEIEVKGSALRHYFEKVFNFIQKKMKGE